MIVSRREKAANGFFMVVIVAIVAMTLGLLLRGPVAKQEQQTQAALNAAESAARTTQLEARLKAAPNNVEAMVGLGDIYLDSNRAMEAFKLFQRAVELDPANIHALSDMGNLYQQIGKYDKAIESYQSAYEHQPNHTGSLLNMALIYSRHKKDYAKALELLNTFLNSNPEAQLIATAEQEIARIEQATEHGK